MRYIILPQTMKMILPPLTNQALNLVKGTSFLRVVDIPEFMRNSSVVMGQLRTPAQIITLYGFIALTYFVICFSLSCVVRYYQKRLRTCTLARPALYYCKNTVILPEG